MERLGHRAEILAQAGRLAAGDRQRALRGRHVEAHQLGGSGGGREGAAGGGGVEAGLVVARGDRLGDLALDLDAEVIGEHEVPPGGFTQLGDGEGRRQRRRGRMGEQAIDAVLGHRELGVVIVVGVDADAVGEGGEARRHLAAAADDRGGALGQAEIVEVLAHQLAALGDRARQRQAEAVEDGLLAEVDRRPAAGPRSAGSTMNSATYCVSSTSTGVIWFMPILSCRSRSVCPLDRAAKL